MGKVTRFSSLFVAVLATLVLAAGPAAAHIQQFQMRDVGNIQNGTVIISGTITCTAGEEWVVLINTQQKDPQTGEATYRGRGSDKGVCTGDRQRWRVVTDRILGDPDPGPAHATAKARTFSGGVLHDERKRAEVITYAT